ncbi:Ger(x)C family spore germination protein [Alkalihalobacillus sp. AL-G]|uniref:Ger(x)C family spore germination protein n=1 Tax=Alkalihalobacillus sp. AL-G TaxID=2926399 RepID=UPI00272BB453|nr:Ger(x)C family spore germination protein [Alkalihalobacillus sp. AL-G]WLD93637.1 Ger(x)C family spore germination protein [Alkalihalobacillus sp. AL-G]
MKRLSLIIICVVLLAGCTVERRILDDIYLITLAGYDLKEDKIQSTLVVPIFQTGGGVRNEYYTTEGVLNKELTKKATLQAPNPLFPGKIEVALFSEDFARKGFIKTMDVYRRDPSISANVKLAVYDGSTKEFIHSQDVQNMDLGRYVVKIIEHSIDQEIIPKTNLHLFFQKYFGEGEDPFLPLFTLKKGKLKLKGLALFKGDRMIDHVPENKLHLFSLLHNRLFNFALELPQSEIQVAIGNIRAERKVQVTGSLSSPKIKISIDLEGNINEFYGGKKGLEKKLKKIEKQIDKHLEKEAKVMLSSFQEQGIDPIGIGKEAKAEFRDWDAKSWKQIYPELDIKVEVNTNVLETGVMR